VSGSLDDRARAELDRRGRDEAWHYLGDGEAARDEETLAYLAVLRGILDRHHPYMRDPSRGCSTCHVASRMNPTMFPPRWPCTDVQAVYEALGITDE
jgi:hypothetical protein